MSRRIKKGICAVICMYIVTFILLAVFATIIYYLKLDAWVAKMSIIAIYIVCGWCGGRVWRGNPLVPSVCYWLIYIVVMIVLGKTAYKDVLHLIVLLIILFCSSALGAKNTFHI